MLLNVFIVCLICVGLNFGLWHIERSLIFFPTQVVQADPSAYGVEFEDVRLLTPDGLDLQAWWLPHPRAEGRTILFLHGNAGNLGDRLTRVVTLWRLGYNVMIPSYRGYGQSSGRPAEKGLYQDAQASFDWLLAEKQVQAEAVFVFGSSLGGAVAVELAMTRPVAKLVLDSTFTSIADMATRNYPWIPKFLIRTRFTTIDKIKQIEQPVFVIHSPDDMIVPFEMGEAIFQKAQSNKQFIRSSGGHNDSHFYQSEADLKKLDEFLRF